MARSDESSNPAAGKPEYISGVQNRKTAALALYAQKHYPHEYKRYFLDVLKDSGWPSIHDAKFKTILENFERSFTRFLITVEGLSESELAAETINTLPPDLVEGFVRELETLEDIPESGLSRPEIEYLVRKYVLDLKSMGVVFKNETEFIARFTTGLESDLIKPKSAVDFSRNFEKLTQETYKQTQGITPSTGPETTYKIAQQFSGPYAPKFRPDADSRKQLQVEKEKTRENVFSGYIVTDKGVETFNSPREYAQALQIISLDKPEESYDQRRAEAVKIVRAAEATRFAAQNERINEQQVVDALLWNQATGVTGRYIIPLLSQQRKTQIATQLVHSAAIQPLTSSQQAHATTAGMIEILRRTAVAPDNPLNAWILSNYSPPISGLNFYLAALPIYEQFGAPVPTLVPGKSHFQIMMTQLWTSELMDISLALARKGTEGIAQKVGLSEIFLNLGVRAGTAVTVKTAGHAAANSIITKFGGAVFLRTTLGAAVKIFSGPLGWAVALGSSALGLVGRLMPKNLLQKLIPGLNTASTVISEGFNGMSSPEQNAAVNKGVLILIAALVLPVMAFSGLSEGQRMSTIATEVDKFDPPVEGNAEGEGGALMEPGYSGEQPPPPPRTRGPRVSPPPPCPPNDPSCQCIPSETNPCTWPLMECHENAPGSGEIACCITQGPLGATSHSDSVQGIDINAGVGDLVTSITNGVVVGPAEGALYANNYELGFVGVGHTSTIYGNTVTVRTQLPTGQTAYVMYSHLASVAVSPGDQVGIGTQIGQVGNTGVGYGGGYNNAHLHLEVRATPGSAGGVNISAVLPPDFGPIPSCAYGECPPMCWTQPGP